eukprot:TRINITY_DN3360_c0_g1_i8.p1 TRINITY_DN3360_c0_g1~~TRINITY_DN3360_c0_g1_i8.p1  ORF type:complete len:717 (+),score=145.81 TRINITY_DN3360_c0_g1_i8:77-2152(+)
MPAGRRLLVGVAAARGRNGWEVRPAVVYMSPHVLGRGGMRIAYLGWELLPGGRVRKCVVKESTLYSHSSPMAAKAAARDVWTQTAAGRFADAFNRTSVPETVNYIGCEVLLTSEQVYVIEGLLRGAYLKHNNNSGGVYTRAMLPPAFTHFTVDASSGRVCVCDIQGVWTATGLLLTDPQMHSTRPRLCGDGDFGTEGFRRFFATHECNPYCRQLGLSPWLGIRVPRPVPFSRSSSSVEATVPASSSGRQASTEPAGGSRPRSPGGAGVRITLRLSGGPGSAARTTVGGHITLRLSGGAPHDAFSEFSGEAMFWASTGSAASVASSDAEQRSSAVAAHSEQSGSAPDGTFSYCSGEAMSSEEATSSEAHSTAAGDAEQSVPRSVTSESEAPSPAVAGDAEQSGGAPNDTFSDFSDFSDDSAFWAAAGSSPEHSAAAGGGDTSSDFSDEAVLWLAAGSSPAHGAAASGAPNGTSSDSTDDAMFWLTAGNSPAHGTATSEAAQSGDAGSVVSGEVTSCVATSPSHSAVVGGESSDDQEVSSEAVSLSDAPSPAHSDAAGDVEQSGSSSDEQALSSEGPSDAERGSGPASTHSGASDAEQVGASSDDQELSSEVSLDAAPSPAHGDAELSSAPSSDCEARPSETHLPRGVTLRMSGGRPHSAPTAAGGVRLRLSGRRPHSAPPVPGQHLRQHSDA